MGKRYGVIVVSRDRADMLARMRPYWESQKLDVTVLVEKEQAADYERAVGDWTEVQTLPGSNMGVGYARAAALELAAIRRLDAYIMADDDTHPAKDSSVLPLLDFVARGRAINCGGWLSVHGLWYGDHRTKTDHVVPHFGDKLYATNVGLAVEAGGYDPMRWDWDTAEWNRICLRAGFLWWIHPGVRIVEKGAARGEGGIVSSFGSQEKRLAAREECHRYLHEKWGSTYVSPPGTRFQFATSRLIEEKCGRRALETVRNKTAWRDDDPLLPCRLTDTDFRMEQPALW